MAKKPIQTLKDYFKIGKRPTEEQFEDLIDSYVHIDVNDFSYGEAKTNTLTRDNAGASGDGIRSGFYQTANPINFPSGATSWWHLIDVRHTNLTNNYAMQIAGGFFDQDLYYRKTSDDASKPWRKIVAADSNGNVGIGNSTPQAKLDVTGGVNIAGTYPIQLAGADVNHGLKYRTYFEGTSTFLDGPFMYGYAGGSLGTKQGGAEKHVLNWKSNGFVGIGTNAPEAQFHVQFVDSEPKSIQFVALPNTTNTMNECIRYKWYDAFCDVGIIRGGSTDISALAIKFNNNETARFAVSGNAAFQGKVEAKDFIVSTSPTADFVFEPDYNLPKLNELEGFIKERRHLPEIPSAEEMEKQGVMVGEFQIKLLQKIEELTLYLIAQNKEIESLKNND